MLCTNCQADIRTDLVEKTQARLNAPHPCTAADLEKEMSLVETMMEQLALRRTVLQQRINLLSPTAILPAEILTEIFRTTCQLSENTDQPMTALFFGGICKEWRQIAWSTPLLWNHVALHVSRKMHGSQVNLLEEWLLRANTSPLHIKLTSDDEHESIFCSFRAIMDVLVTRSTYWQSLDCLLPPQCHDVLKNNHFPMLTSVSVRPPKGTISTFSEPPNMFLSAPKLLDVDLSGYNFGSMVLPWEQLRRFRTQFLTVAECLKVLRRSPNMKECHLESVYSPEIFASASPEVLRSDLEVLDVSLIKGAAISLLDSVSLPDLRELKIQYSGMGGHLPLSVGLLAVRSACRLERLSLETQNIQDTELIACLQVMPTLLHLRVVSRGESGLSSVGLTDQVVYALDCDHSSGQPFLPQLVSFEYHGRVACDVPQLLDVLIDRWRGCPEGEEHATCTRLLRAEVVATNPLNINMDGVKKDLDILQAEGFQVYISGADFGGQ